MASKRRNMLYSNVILCRTVVTFFFTVTQAEDGVQAPKNVLKEQDAGDDGKCAVIDLSGSLSIDGTLVENGVRLTTTVHTSTGVELLAHLLNGKGVDVKVNLPLEKQQLFTAKSRLDKFAKHRGHPETHTPVKFEPQSEEPRTCFDQLTEIVGLTFCGTLDISPSASLMSPAKLSAWVEKEQDLKQFHFKIFFDVDPEHHGVNFDVLFDTPETKVDRKLNLGIQLALEPKPLVKITAHVPWYSVHFQENRGYELSGGLVSALEGCSKGFGLERLDSANIWHSGRAQQLRILCQGVPCRHLVDVKTEVAGTAGGRD
ncbi:hypothetical protein AAG570_004639 [Ranatra chinensis]|uniref:Vitellinogen open beta-sheet domain-containing protein n=1 Tax=Ranatra chinensis TaxID=642074 RepID=A0ABD0YG34_9HEMI